MPNNSDKLVSLMVIIGRRMREEMKNKKGTHPGSLVHFEALRYINENGKPLMRDVAAYFSITPPAATLLIDGLVENKFIARILDAKDRRAVRVMLTAKGKQILVRGIQDKMKKIKEVFSVLDAKEQAELARIYEKIAKGSPQRKKITI